MLFQPDFFSNTRPGWHPVDLSSELLISDLSIYLPKFCECIDGKPEKSNAFGINSNNFRFNSNGKKYVLKRWSHKARLSDVQTCLSVMISLNSLNLPVPRPLQFNQGDLLLSIKSGSWSLFPFIEGDYFSGADDELESVAEMTGLLTQTLKKLSTKLHVGEGPVFFSKSQEAVINQAEDCCDKWVEIFGNENSTLLYKWWPTLKKEWDFFKKNQPTTGIIQAAHFDLHPHNILIDNQKISAILDFESCREMDPGYAIGFAALKQCRQTVANRKAPNDAEIIGLKYVSILNNRCGIGASLTDNLGNFAMCEVIRRICLILELNLNQKESTWNHVLGMQLNHIGEIRAIFN